MVWTVFEYLYRDADNHKAFGKAAFTGSIPPESWDRAFQKLGEVVAFVERLSAVEEWNIWLSPNVECGMPKCIG